MIAIDQARAAQRTAEANLAQARAQVAQPDADVRLAETDAHEGPVYVREEDALYSTSLPRASAYGPVVDIKRLGAGGDLTVVRANANVANQTTSTTTGA